MDWDFASPVHDDSFANSKVSQNKKEHQKILPALKKKHRKAVKVR